MFVHAHRTTRDPQARGDDGAISEDSQFFDPRTSAHPGTRSDDGPLDHGAWSDLTPGEQD